MSADQAAARLMDVAGETNENFNPIYGVLASPLLTLLAAVTVATGGSAALTVRHKSQAALPASGLAVGLTKSLVGIVVANVCKYCDQLCACEGDPSPTDRAALARFHGSLVEALLSVARPKGTVDGVVGDRGRIAFNAVLP